MPLQISDNDISFNVLFHHNPNPMWIVEIDTLRFKAVNDAAVKHYGYSRDEFIDHITLANIRPLYEQQAMLDLIKRIKHNQTIRKDLSHVKKDGSLIYVNITSFTVTYHNANCRMVIIHDITEQRLKDMKLTEAVARINETLESITDGFITLDNKLRTTYWNKEATRILCTNRDAVIHKCLWQVYPYYRELSVFKNFNEALSTGQTIKFEDYIPALEKWIRFTVYPGADGLAVYFQDVTAQKRDEQQISKKNESLGHIAYLNSHMMRKPLANILGIINSLEGEHDEHLNKPLGMLRQSAIELDNIIKDINNSVEQTIK